MNQWVRLVIFYLMVGTISFLFYVWPIDQIRYWLTGQSIPFIFKGLSSVFVAILIVYYLRSSNTFFLLKRFVYDGLGIGFISFLVCFFCLGLFFLSSIPPFQIGGSAVVAITLILIFGYIQAAHIRLKKIELSFENLSENVRLLFMSDIHLGTNSEKHLEKLLKKVSGLDIDMICIGGDLIDSSSFQVEQLAPLLSIRVPIFFVTGNHEYYLKNSAQVCSQLKDYNISWLNNKNVTVKGVNIIGLNDNQTHEQKIKYLQSMLSQRLVNMVLVHKPCLWKVVQNKPNLMLSGHTHAGQIWPFHWLVKVQFPHYYGKYEQNKNVLLVSSGAGTWGPRIRLGSCSEILLIDLKKE